MDYKNCFKYKTKKHNGHYFSATNLLKILNRLFFFIIIGYKLFYELPAKFEPKTEYIFFKISNFPGHIFIRVFQFEIKFDV